MDEIRVWKIVHQNGQNPKATPVEKVDKTETELLLENVLTAAPDLLMPSLTLVGRQTETPTGPLDLLGVDEDGRLVVFELKRGKLTRDAVAQAIDYGSYLASLEPEGLCNFINKGHGLSSDSINFAQWYQENFPSQPLANIGAPRIVLVGLGVDEAAKRMVSFLARAELDISLITFQGFKQGEETLLARQVEVQSQSESAGTSKKHENQVKLNALLANLGIAQSYAALVSVIKEGLGASNYQSPNPNGYSFFLPEVSAGGANRSYIALYAPASKNGQVQILLQDRAIKAVGEETVKQAAEMMKTSFTQRIGYGEIWIDGRQPTSRYTDPLRTLSQAIGAGWKVGQESQSKAEAAEANDSPAHGAFVEQPG